MSKASKTINLSEDIFSGNNYFKLHEGYALLSDLTNVVTIIRLQFNTTKGLCNTS